MADSVQKMSFTKTLESARTLLRSDKIKDRSSGYESFQQLFASAKVIQHLAPRYDEDHALVDAPLYDIFQAVFAAVVAERAASLKTGATAAAQTRLAEATRTLRTMVERSVDVLDRGTVRAIMAHAQQSIVVKFQIHEPIAADYVKVMRAILACRAHREHLTLKAWYESTAICFAGVLGTRVHKTADWSTDPPLGPVGEDEEEDDPRPRKRNRLDESTPPSASVSRPPPRRVATPLVRNFASLVQLLFQAPVAPLAVHADIVLDFFWRFFTTYPHEVTAHADIVSALHRTMVELELNANSALRAFVPRVWSSLVGLWNTKNEALQDELILTFTYALPFLSGDNGDVGTLLDPLYQYILEPPRGGDEVLPQSSIALCDKAPPAGPFRTSLFTSSSSFTSSNARAWAVLELGADVWSKLCEADETARRVRTRLLLVTEWEDS